jgi:aspartate kinase
MSLTIHKYGGTSVGTLDRIRHVAQRSLRAQQAGGQVVVVVSAMAGETNRLVSMAHDLTALPNAREMDVLVSTGEQVSIALLAIAIHAAGGKASSFLADQIGMRTDNRHGRARIVSVDDTLIRQALERDEIVVVAGFQGVDTHGNITTLGRGGSDTTAVALAAALGADACEIHTDVDGIYTADPGICPDAHRIDRISYEEMLELSSLGAKVLQVRSVEFAMNHNVPIHVRSAFNEEAGSWVTKEEASMESVRVRGVTSDTNTAKITLKRVPDQPGVVAQIFSPLAQAGVNVDVILQNVSEQGTTDVTFTVARSDLEQVRTIMDPLTKTLGTAGLATEANVAKVSLVGAGMRSHAGVAALAFQVLGDAGINIQMINTSEIKISCVVTEGDSEQAVRLLHNAFGLGESKE